MNNLRDYKLPLIALISFLILQLVFGSGCSSFNKEPSEETIKEIENYSPPL